MAKVRAKKPNGTAHTKAQHHAGKVSVRAAEQVLPEPAEAEVTPLEPNEIVAEEAAVVTEPVEVAPEPTSSVKAETHSGQRQTTASQGLIKELKGRRWPKLVGLTVGVVALLTLVVSGVLTQYFKGKTLPNVAVAGRVASAKTEAQLKSQLEGQLKDFSLTLTSGEKKLTPSQQELGLEIKLDETVDQALQAKRHDGLFNKLAFWREQAVPVVVKINDSLLAQYLETHLPELSKAPQDAQLQFDATSNEFKISEQADGQGADASKLKLQLKQAVENLKTEKLSVSAAPKAPVITKAKLEPLVAPANALVSRQIVLTGLGYSYQARPADIASWVTPTPKPDGKVTLVVDPAKIQSYVDSIGKKISNAPVDKKVLKDEVSGAEVVLQQGRDGTELADKASLANAITQALKSGQDSNQTMNIKVAAFQTVNMNAYEKWIEVDLSEQRTTAYERATPVKNFLIASGMRGHETPVGEYAIWLRVRKQTMQGGSKADGSYYSIPNVEWVSYFYKDYALHGAWWREKFGYPASHGCVNMTNADAQWVFEWAPIGTKVIVHA